MKKQFAGFLTAALLLGLLSVGASAAEPKYAPLTLELYNYATLTIDKARVTYAGKEDGEYSIYGVPADAKATITVTGAQKGYDFYIGAIFQLLSNGNANTVRVQKKSAECILNADNVLQRVYFTGENGSELEEDTSWVGNSDYIRQNGTYSFTLNAADYVGWNFSLLCGDRTSPHFASPDTIVHGYFLESYFEESKWISLVVEKAVGAASSIAPSTGAFTDVTADSYCYDAAQWAVKQGITAGKTATTFAPGETCTKGQILAFLWRANGQPEPAAANPFTDVTQSNYYYKAALWASEQRLVSGSVFGADAPCTRAMAVTYLWTLAGKPAPEKGASFTDVAADAAYAKAVAWAVEKGITSGKTADTFAPDATCTRGQIATFLYRAMH